VPAKAPILGWRIDRVDRERLLALVPPRYAETVADHVTHGRKDAAPPMPPVASARIVGRADDGEGVEALVVTLDGSSDRWDGSTYHITWSLGPGREAKESNDVIAAHGWQLLSGLPEVGLTPEEWP
jgi:hypothetical protein